MLGKMIWKAYWYIEDKAQKLAREEKGQAFSEYAIVIGVVAVLIIATMVLFKNALIGVFTRIINSLNGVGT